MKGKCGGMGLCPISLGLAFGITSALAMFGWMAWVIYQGAPPMMQAMPIPTWNDAGMHALWALIKGFVFGFVLALVYDCVLCLGSKFCSKGSKSSCGCNCSCNKK